MKIVGISFLIVGVILFVALGVIAVVQSYHFDRNCGDYLKLAGDAPTIVRANDFLKKAISYLEETGKTSGDSAVIFKKKPSNDIEIWYQQLVAAEKTTEEILAKGDKAPQLEKDNALMKIRETVLDQGQDVNVTHPAWISIYPDQVNFFGALVASAVFIILGSIFFVWAEMRY